MVLKEGISVIIASYNRPDIFQTVFKSYLKDHQVKEFILINDGSELSYDILCQEISLFCRKKEIVFKYLKNKQRQGAPASRNIGLGNAEYRYVFFSDDDMRLAEGTTSKLLHILKKKKAQAAGCRIYYLSTKEYSDDISHWNTFAQNVETLDQISNDFNFDVFVTKKTKDKITSTEYVSGTLLYDLSFLKKNNIKFYEKYRGNGFREETDAQIQVRRKGGTILFCSDCLCFHLPYEILNRTGQRRAGKLWYESWIFINNLIFYQRHSGYFKKTQNLTLYKYLYYFYKNRYFIRFKNHIKSYLMKMN